MVATAAGLHRIGTDHLHMVLAGGGGDDDAGGDDAASVKYTPVDPGRKAVGSAEADMKAPVADHTADPVNAAADRHTWVFVAGHMSKHDADRTSWVVAGHMLGLGVDFLWESSTTPRLTAPDAEAADENGTADEAVTGSPRMNPGQAVGRMWAALGQSSCRLPRCWNSHNCCCSKRLRVSQKSPSARSSGDRGGG